MGLLLKLNNGDTQLKSLTYSKDQPGGGYSGLPLIQEPIPFGFETPQNFPDFILRGGLNAPLDALEDTIRLKKYFFSLKHPGGLLFTAKQNLLSRTGAKTEATKGLFNEGFYNPISTLAQTALGFIGTHINKTSIVSYQEAIKQNQLDNFITNGNFIEENNRLIALTQAVKTNTPTKFSPVKNYYLNTNNHLISYLGGSKSVLGIGLTNINFSTDNAGAPLKTLNPLNKQESTKTYETDLFIIPTSASNKYGGIPITSSNNNPTYLVIGNNSYQYNLPTQSLITKFNNLTEPYTSSNSISSSVTQYLINKGYKQNETEIGTLVKTSKQNPSPSWYSGEFNIKENVSSSIKPSDNISKIIKPKKYNEITQNRKSETYYDSTLEKSVRGLYPLRNSLIKFNIDIVDPRSPTSASSLPFTAYIDNLSDSYGAEWNAQTYMGRGEKFYKYGNFSRDISFGFTVAVESKNLLTSYYNKLNELAASLAPTYTSAGYLTGNFHKVTIGNYIKNQYGIITSLSYDIIEESPWDISQGEQLPFYIKVSGIKFIPIHTFRPESWFNAKNNYIKQ